jgi:hypothetical protein
MKKLNAWSLLALAAFSPLYVGCTDEKICTEVKKVDKSVLIVRDLLADGEAHPSKWEENCRKIRAHTSVLSEYLPSVKKVAHKLEAEADKPLSRKERKSVDAHEKEIARRLLADNADGYAADLKEFIEQAKDACNAGIAAAASSSGSVGRDAELADALMRMHQVQDTTKIAKDPQFFNAVESIKDRFCRPDQRLASIESPERVADPRWNNRSTNTRADEPYFDSSSATAQGDSVSRAL